MEEMRVSNLRLLVQVIHVSLWVKLRVSEQSSPTARTVTVILANMCTHNEN